MRRYHAIFPPPVASVVRCVQPLDLADDETEWETELIEFIELCFELGAVGFYREDRPPAE